MDENKSIITNEQIEELKNQYDVLVARCDDVKNKFASLLQDKENIESSIVLLKEKESSLLNKISEDEKLLKNSDSIIEKHNELLSKKQNLDAEIISSQTSLDGVLMSKQSIHYEIDKLLEQISGYKKSIVSLEEEKKEKQELVEKYKRDCLEKKKLVEDEQKRFDVVIQKVGEDVVLQNGAYNIIVEKTIIANNDYDSLIGKKNVLTSEILEMGNNKDVLQKEIVLLKEEVLKLSTTKEKDLFEIDEKQKILDEKKRDLDAQFLEFARKNNDYNIHVMRLQEMWKKSFPDRELKL